MNLFLRAVFSSSFSCCRIFSAAVQKPAVLSLSRPHGRKILAAGIIFLACVFSGNNLEAQCTTATITAEDLPGTASGPFTKSIGGQTFTFTPANDNYVSIESQDGLDGLYCLNNDNDLGGIKFTISAPAGYSFDLGSFKYFSANASLGISIIFLSGSTSVSTLNTTPGSVETFNSFSTVPNDITSITFETSDFAIFNDFCISDIKPILPPTAITEAATNITTTTAKLNATVNDNGQNTTVKFRINASESTVNSGGGNTAAAGTVNAGTGSKAVTFSLNSNISAGNVYYYRVEAINNAGTTNGSTLSFTTRPVNPTGLSFSNVTATGFTVNWNISTSSIVDGYRLDVATNSNFTTILPSYDNLFISGKSTVSLAVTGLSERTQYWCRLRAENAGGASSNSTSPSQVTAGAPSATTNAATTVTTTSALVNATVNDNGLATTVKFRLHTNPSEVTSGSGGNVQSASSVNAGAGSTAVSYNYTTLSPGNTYYYRVEATNTSGTVNGGALSVTTLPDPPSLLSASNITTTGFTINWNASTSNLVNGYRLDVATDAGFSSILPSYGNLFISGKSTVSKAITGLTPGTQYWYRLRAENAGGISANSSTGNQYAFRPPVAGFGNALDFDGVNDYVSIPDNASLKPTSGITLAAWINTRGSGDYQFIFGKEGNPDVDKHYLFALDNNRHLHGRFYLASTGFNKFFTTTASVPLNTWTYVAVSYDNSTVRVYINGTEVQTFAWNENLNLGNGTTPLTLGIRGGDLQLPFKGMIDEAKVWNRKLDASEILNSMYRNTSTTGLAGYWKLDESSGTSVADNSPQGNNGTMINMDDADHVASSISDITVAANPAVYSGSLAGSDMNGGNPLVWSIVSNALKGTAVITDASTGAYTYTPSAGTFGSDIFTYQVNNGSDNSGTATVHLNITKPPVAGFGSALLPNGSTGKVTITPAAGALGTGDFTITGWFKASGNGAIVSNRTAPSSETRFFSIAVTNGKLVVELNGADGGAKYHGLQTSDLGLGSDDKWHHVVFERTGTTYDAYLDGTNVLTTVIAGTMDLSSGQNLIIGGRYSNASFVQAFHGQLDEISVWSRALTPTERTTSMYKTFNGNESGLTALWKFNEGSGVTAYDESPNGYHGTISGSTYNNADIRDFSTGEDAAYSGILPGSEQSGDALTYSVVTNGTKGTVSITNAATGAFTYTPNSNTNGSDNFTFKVNDGSIDASPATVNITIDPVNDAPTLSAGSYSLPHAGTGSTTRGVRVSDILAGLTYADIDAGAQSGIAVTAMSGSGNWQYSTDNSTWTDIAPVSATGALLLSSTAYMRYVAPGSTETAGLTFRAWDQTSGTASANGARQTADAGTNGGSTAFSTGTGTAELIVYAKPGNALDFEGTASSKDLVFVPNTTHKLNISGNTITIEAWIKPHRKTDVAHESNGNDWNTILMKGSYGYGLAIGGSSCQNTVGKLGFWGQNACGNVPFSTKAIDYDRWNHVAVSINNGSLTYYINGEQAGTATVSVPNDGNSDLYIGVQDGTTGGSGVFYGSMDELRIWSSARTATEIRNNMYNEVDPASTSLVAYYRFEGGIAGGTNTGNTLLHDAAANPLDGTLNYFGLSGSTGNWVESYAMVAPQLSAASSISSSGFTANWSAPAVGTVDKYLLDVSANADFSSFVSGYGGKDMGTATSGVVTGLGTGTSYYYRVRADKTSVTGTGANQASQSITTNTVVSSITRVDPSPTNVTSASFTVTFANAVTGVDATDFFLTMTGTASGTIGTPAGSGTTWTVPVTAISGDGTLRLDFMAPTGVTPHTDGNYTSGEAYTIDNTAPAVPAGLNATPGDAQVVLNWNANSDPDLAFYKVYGGTAASPNTLLTTVTAPAVNFTDISLTNGTTYYYRITSVDDKGNESAKTSDITGIPKASQTITFAALSPVNYGDADINPGATASSTLAITYQSGNTAVATIVAGKIHITGAGTAVITASQGGNDSYVAASDQTQTLTVNRKDITVSVDNTPVITKPYNGSITATLEAGNYNLAGVESGDISSVNVAGTAAYDTKDAGSGKTITVSGFVLSGSLSGNYHLTTASTTTTGNITAKPVTLTLNGTPAITKQYDGSATATLAPGNYTLQNLESGDDVNVTGTASYNDATAGTGKTITVNGFVLSGAQKDNYHLSTTTATVTGNVTIKPLTVTLSSTPLVTKEYDKTTGAVLAAGNYILSNIVNSDAVSVTGTAVYSDDLAGTGKTITVNSFVLSGADKDNYSLAPATLTVTGDITAKPISLTLNATPLISKPYDKSTTATLTEDNYALNGVISGDAVSVTGTAVYSDDKAQNGKTITVNAFVLSGAQKDNYHLSTSSATVTGNITAKPITLTLNGTPVITKQYDGSATATLAPGNYTLQNLESGDDVNVNGTASYNDATAGTGKTITVNGFVLSGAQKDNYHLSTTAATVTGNVTTKPLTVTLSSTPLVTKEYDKTTGAVLAAGNYVLSNIVNSDAVSVTGTAVYSDDLAGTGKTITVNSFVLSGADKDNYSLAPATLTVTGDITAKPISLTLNAAPLITKVYDGTLTATPAAANYVPNGVKSGDDVRITGTAAYDTRNMGSGKTVTVNNLVLSGAQKDNYQLITVSAVTTGNITALPISVTADAKSKIYGDADPSLTYSFAPALINGDAFTGTLTRSGGEAVDVYGIQQGSLSLSADYALSYIPADLTISAKPISITADAKSKTYGDADPSFTYSFTPALISGDVFTGTLTRIAGENAADYGIEQGSLSLPSNYVLSYLPAKLTINAKAVNVTADTKNKIYGDTDPALTYSFAPILVSGDVFTGSLTRVSGERTGNYPVTLGTLSLPSNYTISFTGTDFTINAKPISVTADAKSKTYGDADPELTYQFSPALVSGDAFTGTLTRTAGETVGAYPIRQGSLALSPDYVFNYTTADLTIAPSANADLGSLVINSGTLSPVFDAAVQSYSVTVSHTTTSIMLTPTAAADVSSIKVGGVTIASGTLSDAIALNPGDNTISLEVTAQDGSTKKTYTLHVNRIAVSSNADLSALVLDAGTLQPGFHTDTLSYTAAIAPDIVSMTLTPTTTETASVIDVNGAITASGNAISVATPDDITTVTITVTAEDGTTQKLYIVQLVKPVTTWTGISGNAWTNAGNWTNGVPDLTKLAVIADVQPRPLVSSNQSVMNIIVNKGAAISLTGNLAIAGNLVNNGNFSGTGTLVFNGNTAQQISGKGRIANMTNNNVNGLSIAGGAASKTGITGILTLAAGNFATGDNLVLVSDSLGTAALAPVPAGASVTGKVTVERWIQAQRGYRTLGHPFNSALPLSQLQDNFSISGSGDGFVTGLGYSTASISYYDSVGINPPAFKRPLSNAPNSAASPVWTVGRGILALVRGKGNEGLGGTYAETDQPSAFAADATGNLNQGSIEYRLGANALGTSFNLVGNPYAAPINIKLLKSNSGAALHNNNGTQGVGNTIYVYNPHKNAGISATPSQEVRGGMDAYTNDGTTDIIIPSFGAFFVQSKAAGNVIAFDENVKTVSQQPIAIMGGSASRLTLSLENSRGSWDDIKIRWDKTAGAAGTDSYDGVKMSNELLDLYSISSDNRQLCIDSRSDSFNREEIIPLGIHTSVKDPSFRFRVSAYKMPVNIQVFLRDKLLNTETLLSAVNDTYGFAITADSLSKGDTRFELAIRFRKENATPVDDLSAEVKITPNPFRNELVIQLGIEARSSGATQVRLIGMNGLAVKTVTAASNASMIRMNTIDLAAGVYFVEVINDKMRTIKQVIRQ